MATNHNRTDRRAIVGGVLAVAAVGIAFSNLALASMMLSTAGLLIAVGVTATNRAEKARAAAAPDRREP